MSRGPLFFCSLKGCAGVYGASPRYPLFCKTFGFCILFWQCLLGGRLGPFPARGAVRFCCECLQRGQFSPAFFPRGKKAPLAVERKTVKGAFRWAPLTIPRRPIKGAAAPFFGLIPRG